MRVGGRSLASEIGEIRVVRPIAGAQKQPPVTRERSQWSDDKQAAGWRQKNF